MIPKHRLHDPVARVADAATCALHSLGYETFSIGTVESGEELMLNVLVTVEYLSLTRLYWLLSDSEPARIEHFIRRYLAMLEAPRRVTEIKVRLL